MFALTATALGEKKTSGMWFLLSLLFPNQSLPAFTFSFIASDYKES